MFDIPKTMKAVVYYNNHDVRLEERPVPEIGPGELLVKLEACGLSHAAAGATGDGTRTQRRGGKGW